MLENIYIELVMKIFAFITHINSQKNFVIFLYKTFSNFSYYIITHIINDFIFFLYFFKMLIHYVLF